MHDTFHDDVWTHPRHHLCDQDRVSHLVFVDGRLVDAWSEDVEDSAYEQVARRYDAERRPQVVHAPPPPPRHLQMLAWLDGIVGGRDALLSLAPQPDPPPLRDVLHPDVDEPWLVVHELLVDACESLLSPELAPPLARCLLLVRERAPWLPERTSVARIAAGIVWVVGKANAAIGPSGPVTQVSLASHLGVDALHASGTTVLGHLRRLGWTANPPYPHPCPALLATGRPALLTARVVADLVRLRDEALAEQAGVLPLEVDR